MKTQLYSHPIVIVGWSASEPYLQVLVDDALAQRVQKGQIEELSIVDVKFNAAGHTKLATCYELSQAKTFFSVSDGSGVGTDELFLWIQARYCLDRLMASSPRFNPIITATKKRAAAINLPTTQHFLIDWADEFMPAWTRLCWRAGIVLCVGYQWHKLALDRPDEHIPWRLAAIERHDLVSAANLLRCLPEDGGQWNLRQFPGALWDATELRLVIPLPVWAELNHLAALKPLLRNTAVGLIRKLEILPLHFDPAVDSFPDDSVLKLKTFLAQAMSIPEFAEIANIGVADDIRPS